MSWQWRISGGTLYAPGANWADNPQATAHGYSGAEGLSQNNPAYCPVKEVGPIPVGTYGIGKPIDTAEHGPFVLPLTPATANSMYGRGSFLVHGDSKTHPAGCASKGCIVLPRVAREAIWNSGDRMLVVVP